MSQIFLSKNNTTTTPLGANQSFVGNFDILNSFQELDVTLNGLPLGAPGVLYFEFSPDGINWDVSVPITLTSPSIIPIPLRVILPYFRLRYVNGSTPLTQFRLATTLHRTTAKHLTRFLNQEVDANEPVENVRAILSGFKLDGYVANIIVQDDGSFITSDKASGLNNNPIQIYSNQIGGSDGVNLQAARIFDLDTGSGTEYNLGVSIRLPGNGGSSPGGTNTNPIRTDPTNSTPTNIAGLGTAGSPTGGILTIQGSASGTPIPISGSISATNPSVSGNSAAFPSSSTQVAGAVSTSSPSYSDGNLNPFSLTLAGALRTDSSSTVQPISVSSLPLPTGAVTDAVITARLGTLGQKTSAGSAPVVIASDQSPIPITGSITATNPSVSLDNTLPPIYATQVGGTASTTTPTYQDGYLNPLSLTTTGLLRVDNSEIIQPVSGTVAATQSGTWTIQPGNSANTVPWLTTINQGGNSATVSAGGALKTDSSATIQPVSISGTVAISAASLPLPSGAATESTLSARLADSTFTSRINTLGQKTSANSTPVVIASDQSTISVSLFSVPLPTGAATETTLAKIPIAQSTALGSNSLVMSGGSVTTSSPTYSNGNINPLSLTTAGALRIDGSGSTQPISGTITANAGTGNFTVVQSTAANLLATVTSSGGALALDSTLTAGSVKTQISNGTNQASVLNSSPAGSEYGLITRNIPSGTQTISGTVSVSGTVSDDVTDRSARLLGVIYGSQGQQIKQSASNFNSVSEIAVGASLIDPRSIRVLTSSDTVTAVSGTAGNFLATVTGSGNFTVVQSTAANLNVTAVSNIGTTGGLALDATLTGGAAKTKITDGTNLATIKPASTAAVVTDTSIVVAISPNSPITTSVARPATATSTNVSASASNVTLLAANSSRLGATIFNDSTATLYVKLGTTASLTSFTVLMVPNAYYEIPFAYTGNIDSISSSATGTVRIVELTP